MVTSQLVTNRWYQSGCIVGARLSVLFRRWVSLGIAQSLQTCQEESTGEGSWGRPQGPTTFFMNFGWEGLEFMDHWEMQVECTEEAAGARAGDGS